MSDLLKFMNLIFFCFFCFGLYFSFPNIDHPWLVHAKKASNVSLGETVKARLKQFSVMNKLKKRALRVISRVFYNAAFVDRKSQASD